MISISNGYEIHPLKSTWWKLLKTPALPANLIELRFARHLRWIGEVALIPYFHLTPKLINHIVNIVIVEQQVRCLVHRCLSYDP